MCALTLPTTPPSLQPSLLSSHLASFLFLQCLMASPPQGLCTRGSLCLKLFFHVPHHLILIHPCNLSSDLISLSKAFPSWPPPLLRPSPLLNCRLWVVYLQHIFLPEPGRKWDCAVLRPQEETALPWGPSRLAGLYSLSPSDLRPITGGPHLIGL